MIALLLTACHWFDAAPSIECEAPLVAAGSTCCWPGQTEVDGTCAGVPSECPTGWSASEQGCRADVDIATTSVPAGSFRVGCVAEEPWCDDAWSAQQDVTLTRGLVAMVHEMTQGPYAALTGERPSRMGDCDACPVEHVSWFDAIAAANLLSLSEGLDPAYQIDGTSVTWVDGSPGWRLPTEAEWEWMARANQHTVYAGSDTLDEVAWWEGNNEGRPSQVGTKQPNAFGLYDMSGNVWEWVWDHPGKREAGTVVDPRGPDVATLPSPSEDSKGDEHLVKGGAWADFPQGLHPGYAGFIPATHKGVELGFRLVRTAD